MRKEDGMSNELQTFIYNNNTVRTIEKNGEPWFVLKDVCEILGLGTPARVVERLEKDEVSLTHITDSIGRKQETTVVNESGLYNVIIRSDKPEAKPFRKWITAEVLPTIRKTGAYMTPETIEKVLMNPDTIISLATQLKELQTKVEQDKPKVLFADAVAASHTSILIGDLAKLIRQNGVEVGQNRLFQWLRDNGYLIKRKGSDWNMPTQRSIEMGLLEIKESTHIDGNGCNVTTKTPKVTGKGQAYFVNKFLAS